MTTSYQLFKSIFTPEEEIILLQEYKRFVETHGHHVRNKWVEFFNVCSLNQKYKEKQISKKFATLEKKYLKQKKCSLVPSDRLFLLSESLWGDQDPPTPKSRPQKRSLSLITTSEQLQPSKMKPGFVEELELYHKTLILQHKQYEILLQKVTNTELNTPIPSSSSMAEKNQWQSEEKEIPVLLNEERDLSNSSSMENVFPLQVLSGNVEDDGTKKTSSKKKKKKKKKTRSPQVKYEPFGLAIEVLKDGDLHGDIVCKGAKVRVDITGKLKGSEQIFESRICQFKLGDERIIDGLRSGIIGMRVGEKRRLTIPPFLGFGDEGFGDLVPPNSWLVYEGLINVANLFQILQNSQHMRLLNNRKFLLMRGDFIFAA